MIGTLSQTPHKKLDPSNYEDIVRTLMGEQAFLLFVFDKLILQVSFQNHILCLALNFCSHSLDFEEPPCAQICRRVPAQHEAIPKVQQAAREWVPPKRAPLPHSVLVAYAVSNRVSGKKLTHDIIDAYHYVVYVDKSTTLVVSASDYCTVTSQASSASTSST